MTEQQTNKFQVTVFSDGEANDQMKKMYEIAAKLGIQPNRNAVFHFAMEYLCQHEPKLAGVQWGGKPPKGGNRGGAEAQAKQKRRARANQARALLRAERKKGGT